MSDQITLADSIELAQTVKKLLNIIRDVEFTHDVSLIGLASDDVSRAWIVLGKAQAKLNREGLSNG